MPPKSKLKKFYHSILNTLFPISCLGCNQPDTWLCNNCLEKIKLNDNPELPRHKDINHLDKLISACHYKNSLLQKIIPTFKYKYATELAKPLAKILIKTLEQFELPKNTLLIPVPLHRKRFNERGFNQAELIAKHLAKHFNLEVNANIIKRTKNTGHQARLSRKQRLKNLNQAFTCANPNKIKNKNIILVDDVSTTGATLNKIAGVLKRAGVKICWGIVIAHE